MLFHTRIETLHDAGQSFRYAVGGLQMSGVDENGDGLVRIEKFNLNFKF